jgi:hypothetical protein
LILRYDWKEITSSAYLTLIEFGVREFPVTAKNIKLKDVVISSYQKYAEITELSVEQISLECEFDDALLIKGLRPGLKLILYNSIKYDARLKHTLLHEVGHIKLDHKRHGDREEVEAHFFATQANAPNVVIKAIAQRGYKVDVRFLIEHFGLSEESATKKMEYLGKYAFDHTNEFDDTLLFQFSDYINATFPLKSQHFHDEYFDELDRERENWH